MISGDLTFNRHTSNSLVWLAERGMGYFPVSAPDSEVYDEAYWAKYVEYSKTRLGLTLNHARVAITEQYVSSGDTICDVGIGCGQFVEALRGRDHTAYGTDVNPHGVSWLRERGWFMDPYTERVDAATLWDVLEHLHDPAALIKRVRSVVVTSLPIFTDAAHVLRSRHYRQTEHRWYWTRDGLITWMLAQGFHCRFHSTVETLLGREDIHTFAFVRKR